MAEEEASKTVGTILREAREAKGLNLQAIEYATNIHVASLQLLENDEYDKTPGEFFVKGAIRTYGNYLGLDGLKLVNMYKASKAGQDLHSVEAKGIREASQVTMKLQLKNKIDIGAGTGKRELPSLPKIPWAKIGIGIGALAVVGALYFAIPMVMQKLNTPAAPAKVAEPATQPVPADPPKTETTKTATPAVPKATTPTVRAAQPAAPKTGAVQPTAPAAEPTPATETPAAPAVEAKPAAPAPKVVPAPAPKAAAKPAAPAKTNKK